MTKKELTPKDEFVEQAYDLERGYENRFSSKIPTKYGICSQCTHLNYVSSEFGKELATCSFDETMYSWPNTCNPMMKCSRYYKKGQQSLIEMANMATYIEVKKRNIGF